MAEKKATAAQMRATAKYEKANYDKVLIRFPKGTKERIAATGKSLNGYVVESVLMRLAAVEQQAAQQQQPQIAYEYEIEHTMM